MKRGKKMLTIIFITTVAIGLITWGVLRFLDVVKLYRSNQ